MAKSKRQQRRQKRRYVNRNERHGPTRETVANLPVDPFVPWAALGEAHGGLDPQQVTALLNLADAFASVTAKLGYKPMVFQWQAPGAPRDMTPAEARAWTVWFAWAIAFERQVAPIAGEKRISGFHIAQWVAKRDRKINAGETADPRLAVAARLWTAVSDDYGKSIDVSAANYRPNVRQHAESERSPIRAWEHGMPETTWR